MFMKCSFQRQALAHRLLRALLVFVLLATMLGAVAAPLEPNVLRNHRVSSIPRAPSSTLKDCSTTAPLPHLNESPAMWSEGEGAAARSRTPPLSLRRACADELSQHCPTTSSLRCLMDTWAALPATQRTAPLFSKTCASWLVARDACFAALQQVGSVLCRDAVHGRECLRRVPRVLLPTQCVNSDYFRSVLLLDAMRK